MNEVPQVSARGRSPLWVAAGEDRFGEDRGNGIGNIAFKVATRDSSALFIMEMTLQGKGGPARHMHLEQDEWFYPLEGKFIIEVGQERFDMGPGDSLFAPRRVPHAWAHVGDSPGRMLFALAPAGKIEAFLREIARANAMAPQDPGFWPPFDMELVGPPLSLE